MHYEGGISLTEFENMDFLSIIEFYNIALKMKKEKHDAEQNAYEKSKRNNR